MCVARYYMCSTDSSESDSSSDSDDSSSSSSDSEASAEDKKKKKSKGGKQKKARVDRMDKQEAEINARTSVAAQIDEMYQTLYGQDLYSCESIGDLFLAVSDKLARDGKTDTKSKEDKPKYDEWLRLCRNDVQKNFDAAVVEVAGHQATVTQAEKKFVIKMRSIILKDKKLVRKIDFHKVCHKSLNKVVEKFVELKGEESRRFNRWGTCIWLRAEGGRFQRPMISVLMAAT